MIDFFLRHPFFTLGALASIGMAIYRIIYF